MCIPPNFQCPIAATLYSGSEQVFEMQKQCIFSIFLPNLVGFGLDVPWGRKSLFFTGRMSADHMLVIFRLFMG